MARISLADWRSRSSVAATLMARAIAPRYASAMASGIDDVIVVTTNDVGLIVRARNVFSNFGASLRTLVGGEVGGYTQLLTDSRLHAVERLRAAAVEKGGNAVVAMRFDCNEIAGIMSEIAAYGTAVTIRPK
jgi:uncharacterized protein YbjQ (UPF0145 family)